MQCSSPACFNWPRRTLPLAAPAPLWHLRKNIGEKNTMASIRYHEGDISAADAARYTGAIAIDTETLGLVPRRDRLCVRSEEHTSELQSLMRISYAVFCL